MTSAIASLIWKMHTVWVSSLKSSPVRPYSISIEQLNRPENDTDKTKDTYHSIMDDNDSIAYLRAKTINALTLQCAETFAENNERILQGTFNNTLIDRIEEDCPALEAVMALSKKKIYNHTSVVEIEITGFHIMSHLLGLFIPAVLRKQLKGTDRMVRQLIPYQFTEYEETDSAYLKCLLCC